MVVVASLLSSKVICWSVLGWKNLASLLAVPCTCHCSEAPWGWSQYFRFWKIYTSTKWGQQWCWASGGLCTKVSLWSERRTWMAITAPGVTCCYTVAPGVTHISPTLLCCSHCCLNECWCTMVYHSSLPLHLHFTHLIWTCFPYLLLWWYTPPVLKQVEPRWTPCNRLHQESGHMPCASMNRVTDSSHNMMMMIQNQDWHYSTKELNVNHGLMWFQKVFGQVSQAWYEGQVKPSWVEKLIKDGGARWCGRNG